MRFRAQVSNLAAFTKLVDSVAKLSKRAVFMFTPIELKVISTGDVDDGVRFFGTVNVKDLFEHHYVIQSQAANQISLELTTQALASVLRASSGSRAEMVIRLGKSGKTPVLSFVVRAVSLNRTEYELEQHVAVRVLRPADAEMLREPPAPIPNVQITLPKLTDVCKVAERLKSLSSSIHVSANLDGSLKLGIKSEHVNVETEWRGLALGPARHPATPPPDSDSQPPASMVPSTNYPSSHFFHTTVKSRGLLKFLQAHAIAELSLACVCEAHSLIMFIYIGKPDDQSMAGTLVAYLPAVNEDGDD
ncbi:hypothetical protein CROQUDRAFT_103581 [Cronartium quercuum f. sp. fusiforme G11]|uniref:Checkpoint protein n=1 Tax=Cronartium quercuum f. sp. fusiforme G11 TaxID=708437 RepID=A0A9P6THC0_9BASI|nr:hypothetical protein CROQUDRAFT_103581 [Cronartium quercuum f. sp. fusiforme G11]